jgi:hypothetical protein
MKAQCRKTEENMNTLPSYDQLPSDPSRSPKSSWEVWGDDDQLGAINLLTPDRVEAGIACARKGRIFSLNWDVELPNPPFYNREPLKHTIVPLNSAHDDCYDHFYPQQSSQWDALCHVGHPQYGYYNGRTAEDFTGLSGSKNGIDHWARRGIAGRGVLLDVARYFAAKGQPLNPADRVEISIEDLTRVARDGIYEFLLTSAPLNKIGGVGSPANALAIK